MGCSCTSCKECGGTGNIWISFAGTYMGKHRWDDLDEMDQCDQCDGSGITAICDYCLMLDEIEA